MNPSFPSLLSYYASALNAMKITRIDPVYERVKELLDYEDRYQKVSDQTGGVPVAWLMAVNERESSTNFHTYLGNGDPLDERTRDVPVNRGPFDTWEAGAEDALNYDGMQYLFKEFPHCLELCAYAGERWNGWGYRARGVASPYDFADSSVYSHGKFTSDHGYDPNAVDTQFGIMPMIVIIGEVAEHLKIDRAVEPQISTVPPVVIPVHDYHDVELLQRLLGFLTDQNVTVDGSYGRQTRAALQAWQGGSGDASVEMFPKMIGYAIEKETPADASVWLAQAALNLWRQHPPLVVDDVLGPLTQAALAGFQETNSLEASGKLTQETVLSMQDKIRMGV